MRAWSTSTLLAVALLVLVPSVALAQRGTGAPSAPEKPTRSQVKSKPARPATKAKPTRRKAKPKPVRQTAEPAAPVASAPVASAPVASALATTPPTPPPLVDAPPPLPPASTAPPEAAPPPQVVQTEPAPEPAAAAQAAPKRARVVVDVVPAPNAPAWLASALEQTITNDLVGFDRLALIDRADLPPHECGAALDCRVAAYRKADIDVIMFGRVGAAGVDYDLYQTWTPARLATGRIELGRDQSLVGLQHATHDAFHPVLKHGGLLDQRLESDELALRPVDRSRWTERELWFLAGAAALLALPFLAFLVLVRGRVDLLLRTRTFWGAVAVVGAAAGVVPALQPAMIAGAIAEWPWIAAALGGFAWGVVVLAFVRHVFPPLDGLARIAHQDLARVLGTWCLAAGERLLFLALAYAPFALVVAVAARALALPTFWAAFLIAPAVALVARLWFASWIECLAVVLDRRFVLADDAWSRELADYVVGYVRRSGWDIDPALLAGIRFCAGRDDMPDGIVAYAGGPTHARIVVSLPLLELALGALVDVDEKQDDKPPARWPDWTLASAVPRPGGRTAREPSASDAAFRKQRAARHMGVQRKPLGQPATLLGYVAPAPGQIVPLISDNPQDLAVVRELLSEHYPWNAPDPDDEFDATDRTDLDFLFGALARELGSVRRGETRLQTVKLAIGGAVARLSSPIRTRLADSYAAVNHALHPLIQHLYYQWCGAKEPLTARGRGALYNATSRRMLREVAEEAERGAGAAARAARARLIWLSRWFPEPIVDRRQIRTRRAIVAALLFGVVAVGGFAVFRSIEYHPIYVERIRLQEEQLARARAEAEKEKASDGNRADPKAQTN